MSKKKLAFNSKVIHAGQDVCQATGAVMPAICLSTTYAHQRPGEHQGFSYSRNGNPTRGAYESCIADLENGAQGFSFASGMAAGAMLVNLLSSGEHLLVADNDLCSHFPQEAC